MGVCPAGVDVLQFDAAAGKIERAVGEIPAAQHDMHAQVAGYCCIAGANAQTLRWASQGDPQTMDPHSQNESMTNMMNGQVYERLTSPRRVSSVERYFDGGAP